MIQDIGRYTVRVFGRTVTDGGMLWLLSSLSGIGFRITGARRLEIVLESDDTTADPARMHLTPRFAVLVDGDTVIDRCMKEREETVAVFESGNPWGAEIRFRKLSECTQSILAIREIRTDGKIVPLEEKGTKIEFIGDSVTCGYGVEGKNELESFTTATENAGKSYAGLVTDWLGLDSMLTCFSGHGIVSGYTDDPEKRNTDELVPPYYEKEGRNGFRLPTGKLVEEIGRDFCAFQPDYIVLNLGTNDLSWCGTDEARGKQYAKAYTEFLKTVRKDNPGARILCTLGVMGTGLNPMMQLAAENYCKETGDKQIRLLMLEEQNAARDGYGSDYHPNEITQRLLAGTVTEAIERWMKL